MAKKLTIPRDAKFCGDCKLGVYHETPLNRAHDGSYILKRCPYSNRGRFRNDVACSNFKAL